MNLTWATRNGLVVLENGVRTGAGQAEGVRRGLSSLRSVRGDQNIRNRETDAARCRGCGRFSPRPRLQCSARKGE